MLFYLKSCDGGVTSYFYLHEYYTKITWSQRFISFTFQCEITWKSSEILYALIEAEKWRIFRKKDRNFLTSLKKKVNKPLICGTIWRPKWFQIAFKSLAHSLNDESLILSRKLGFGSQSTNWTASNSFPSVKCCSRKLAKIGK